MTRPSLAQRVFVGVDTHKDVHVAAAIDAQGRLLGYRSVATTERGCRELHEWALSLAPQVRYGVEGTGSYGAGLSRYLRAQASSVLEIRGPNRKLRRDRGKSDTIDAEAPRASFSRERPRWCRRQATTGSNNCACCGSRGAQRCRHERKPSIRCMRWSSAPARAA